VYWSYTHRRSKRQEGIVVQAQIGETVRRAWWALVVRGLLALAIGILIVVRPMASVATFALVIALWALTHGIVTVVHAFELRPYLKHWWLMLLSGAISVAFGIAALYYYPGLSLTFAVVWSSWWLMLAGIAGISLAAQERRADVPWGWTMTLGIVSVLASIVAFLNPPATLTALMALIATFAIVAAFVLLIGAYRLRTAVDDITAAVRRAHPT
jgi:uncharacterized membrane protein HdeD (DUF308 family)